MRSLGWVPTSIQVPPSVKRDALLLPALYLLNCLLFSAWLQLNDVATKPWLLLVWLYGLAALIPLAWRDRAPVTVFTIQCILTVAAWPFMPFYTPVVGIPVSLYAVSVHRSRKISLLALLASFIPNALAAAVAFRVYSIPAQQLRSFVPNDILLVIAAAGAWGAGRVTQASQRHVRRLEREQETAREMEVLAAERRRIARELHDIVSHAVTVMVLQAAGAARVANADLSQVKRSLTHIETAGKQVMAELRQLLRVLQAGDLPGHALSTSAFRPQPGLADLTGLLTSFQDTGMPVTVHIEGTTRSSLEPSVDLAAYRIVQEGLTNILKHAGKDSDPRLRLVWGAQSLLIQINNDTNPAEAQQGLALSIGRGLVGLREQAHAVGGCLHTEHHSGGYRLTATLPLADSVAPILVDNHG